MFVGRKSKKNNLKTESPTIDKISKKNKVDSQSVGDNTLINYTREISDHSYTKHFTKPNNLPSFPINIPSRSIEINNMNSSFNNSKKIKNSNPHSNNQPNNIKHNHELLSQNSGNNPYLQQINQQLQFANQLQLMQYRAFLINQQNQMMHQQMAFQHNPYVQNYQNPFLAQQQMMANAQANPNGLVVQPAKSELNQLTNIVAQMGKMMNVLQNQMTMQNSILVKQQKQVIQQQEIIDKLYNKVFDEQSAQNDFSNKQSHNKEEISEEVEEEYLEPSETICELEDNFHSENETIKKNIFNEKSLNNESFDSITIPIVNLEDTNYSNLTSEVEITNEINNLEAKVVDTQTDIKIETSLVENIKDDLTSPTSEVNKQEIINEEDKELLRLLDEAKANPSQRFWESLVGKTKYGFYNNRVWHWLGYFDRFANWHPYKSPGEMPTLPVIHNGLIDESNGDGTFWKRLVDNPNYGHREDGIWIWDGVFDQKFNWIPDPTADKYLLQHYSSLQKELKEDDAIKNKLELHVDLDTNLAKKNVDTNIENNLSIDKTTNSFAFLPKENVLKDDFLPTQKNEDKTFLNISVNKEVEIVNESKVDNESNFSKLEFKKELENDSSELESIVVVDDNSNCDISEDVLISTIDNESIVPVEISKEEEEEVIKEDSHLELDKNETIVPTEEKLDLEVKNSLETKKDEFIKDQNLNSEQEVQLVDEHLTIDSDLNKNDISSALPSKTSIKVETEANKIDEILETLEPAIEVETIASEGSKTPDQTIKTENEILETPESAIEVETPESAIEVETITSEDPKLSKPIIETKDQVILETPESAIKVETIASEDSKTPDQTIKTENEILLEAPAIDLEKNEVKNVVCEENAKESKPDDQQVTNVEKEANLKIDDSSIEENLVEDEGKKSKKSFWSSKKTLGSFFRKKDHNEERIETKKDNQEHKDIDKKDESILEEKKESTSNEDFGIDVPKEQPIVNEDFKFDNEQKIDKEVENVDLELKPDNQIDASAESKSLNNLDSKIQTNQESNEKLDVNNVEEKNDFEPKFDKVQDVNFESKSNETNNLVEDKEDKKEKIDDASNKDIFKEEESKAEKNSSDDDDYWKQFVGNDEYGHYDPNDGSWVWAGYFDDDNKWIKYTDYVRPNCNIIYADPKGEIDFGKYVGNNNFGYYDENGNWDWYAGDYDENGNWVLLTKEDEENASKDNFDDFDPDTWLDQFSSEDADKIFGDINKEK